MQPTKFQISFRSAVKQALAYKAMTNQEAKEHRKNFWVYNREQHADLYATVLERTVERMQLVHLKRSLRNKKSWYTMCRATGQTGSVYRFY